MITHEDINILRPLFVFLCFMLVIVFYANYKEDKRYSNYLLVATDCLFVRGNVLPANPRPGQCYINNRDSTIRIYDGVHWINVEIHPEREATETDYW